MLFVQRHVLYLFFHASPPSPKWNSVRISWDPTSSSIVLPIAATKKLHFWYTWSTCWLVPHFQIQEAASQPHSSSPGHGISWIFQWYFQRLSPFQFHFNPFQLVYQHQMLWQPPPWPSWQKRPGNSQSPAYCLGHVFGQLAHPTESQALIIQVLKWNSNVCLHLRSYDPSLLCLLYMFKTLIHDSNCVYISVCYLGTWKMVVP